MTRLLLLLVAVLLGLAFAPGRAEAQACTREYRPVCAQIHGERRTFPNACTARVAGARMIRPGACRAPTVCPFIYAPVCAVRRGAPPRTFSNDCVARSQGARTIYGGPCRR